MYHCMKIMNSYSIPLNLWKLDDSPVTAEAWIQGRNLVAFLVMVGGFVEAKTCVTWTTKNPQEETSNSPKNEWAMNMQL